ncbi:hypothetical protein PCANC_03237 [Puccinia coronata f. sp. avenae]|uniref:C3H1-type domain-containing protein n=1 Tax=Puccinia coronata f. sp. avenae TaxID=200324 RepID=A0A2N5VYZ8_9BASI|nr:hypothetical protein PCANC_03237 [Puccinia coronata f. sp. avenae]
MSLRLTEPRTSSALLASVLLRLTSTTTSSSTHAISSAVLSILGHADDIHKPRLLKRYLSSTHLAMLSEQQLDQLILSLMQQHHHHQPIVVAEPHQQQQPNLLLPLMNCSSDPSPRITVRKPLHHHPCSPLIQPIPATPPPLSANSLLQKPTSTSASLLDGLNVSASEFKPVLARTHSMPFQSSTTQQRTDTRLPPSDYLSAKNCHPFLLEKNTRTSPIGSPLLPPPSSSSSYHPRSSNPSTPRIPRDPWLKDHHSSPDVSDRLQNHLIEQQLEFNACNTHTLFLPFQSATSPLKSPLLSAISTDPTILSSPHNNNNNNKNNNNNNEPSCPSALQWGLSPEMEEEMAQFSAWDLSDSDGSQPPTIVHHLADEEVEEEEEHVGAPYYAMDKYDKLCAVVAATGFSEQLIDEALSHTGFDTAKAIDFLVKNHAGTTQPSSLSSSAPSASLSVAHPIPVDAGRQSPAAAAALGRAASPALSNPSSPRFIPPKSPDPATPFLKRAPKSNTSSSVDDLDQGPSSRVCRFYLQGCCLRSDCKFSHDIGKVICRFWLKGHCLKGDQKCDFLHEIPDMSGHQEAAPEKKKMAAAGVRLSADEFPSLEESARQTKKQQPSSSQQQQQRRLRPIQLLPVAPVVPSPSLAKLSETYFEKTREVRNDGYELAKEAAKKPEGSAVKRWSREGEKRVRAQASETQGLAGQLIAERNRLMKDAVRAGVPMRADKVDEGPDRMHRGKEMGGGICLGVVAPPRPSTTTTSTTITTGKKNASVPKERMEVLMDLHGLHPDDGVYYLEKFLMALKTEGFKGLAYILTRAPPSSSSSSSSAAGLGLLSDPADPLNGRLEDAARAWLDRKGFSWSPNPSSTTAPAVAAPAAAAAAPAAVQSGIFCIDPVQTL